MRLNLEQSLKQLQSERPNAHLEWEREPSEQPGIDTITLTYRLPLIPFARRTEWTVLAVKHDQKDIDEEEFDALKRAMWLGP